MIVCPSTTSGGALNTKSGAGIAWLPVLQYSI